MVRTAAAAALLLSTLALAAPVRAAETETPVTEAAMDAVATTVTADAAGPVVYSRIYRGAERSALLPSLYISLGALQAYDAYSTLTAVKGGAVEANPMMKGVVGNPLMFTALKAGVTGASILAAERLWKHGKKTQAVLLMVASNGLMAYVAHNNAGVLRSMR